MIITETVGHKSSNERSSKCDPIDALYEPHVLRNASADLAVHQAGNACDDHFIDSALMEMMMTVANTKKLTKPDTATNEPTPPAGDVVVIEPQGRDREKRNGFFVVPAEVFPVPATEVTLPQDRTKKVPLPERFHLEADPAKVVKKHKGHQVDPSRAEGCAPVMPNLELLQATGNPYPKAADETVETADQYKPYVLISHLTYEVLKAKGEFYSADQATIDAVLAEAGVASTFDSRTAVIDTLRDLALFGVVAQCKIGRARLFRPVA